MLRISPSDSADLIDHSVEVVNPDEPLTDAAIECLARLLLGLIEEEMGVKDVPILDSLLVVPDKEPGTVSLAIQTTRSRATVDG